MNTESVTASEIGEYVFCKRGWSLRAKGLIEPTQAMMDGIEGHNALFEKLRYLHIRTIGAWLFIASGIAIMVYIIFFL